MRPAIALALLLLSPTLAAADPFNLWKHVVSIRSWAHGAAEGWEIVGRHAAEHECNQIKNDTIKAALVKQGGTRSDSGARMTTTPDGDGWTSIAEGYSLSEGQLRGETRVRFYCYTATYDPRR